MNDVLTINSLHKSYRQGETEIPVLKELNLNLRKGESLAILGHSGSGKSTLLSLIAGLDNPSAGSINLAGENLGVMDEASLSRFRSKNLGIIFQQFHLISSLTAMENVLLPLEIAGSEQATPKAEKALAAVGLMHRANHFPHQLSGGECQRVAIARAFVSEPKLLLADEPSGNLDDDTGDKVMNLLFDMVQARGMTMILVTHNRELASRCQRLMTLEHGVLHERSK